MIDVKVGIVGKVQKNMGSVGYFIMAKKKKPQKPRKKKEPKSEDFN